MLAALLTVVCASLAIIVFVAYKIVWIEKELMYLEDQVLRKSDPSNAITDVIAPVRKSKRPRPAESVTTQKVYVSR